MGVFRAHVREGAIEGDRAPFAADEAGHIEGAIAYVRLAEVVEAHPPGGERVPGRGGDVNLQAAVDVYLQAVGVVLELEAVFDGVSDGVRPSGAAQGVTSLQLLQAVAQV